MKKNKSNSEVYVMDIRYNDSYNPEMVEVPKRSYRFIVDGDGKEKLIVEEIDDEKEYE